MLCIHWKKIAFLTVLVILKFIYGVQSLRKVSNTTLPVKSDVIVYLRSIERVVEFCKTHTTDIDLNLGFGLFLLNVNLKHVILNKNPSVPTSLQVNLTRTERASGALLEFFQDMVNKNQDPTAIVEKKITNLFNNVNFWVRSMKGYPMLSNTMKPLTRNKENILKKFPPWKRYAKRINEVFRSSPTPLQSDRCLEALGRSPSKLYGPPYKCSSVSKECSRLIYNGTDYGYAIAHRLLFLLAARYSRRCYVYSPQVDSRLISNLCAAMYNEVQYIAANSYMNADLFMEQMLLCTIAGNVDFLQRKWLATILQLQSSFGCFSVHRAAFKWQDSPTELALAKWRLVKNGTQAIMGGECNGHMTAVAAATLSAAVRYITETYY